MLYARVTGTGLLRALSVGRQPELPWNELLPGLLAAMPGKQILQCSQSRREHYSGALQDFAYFLSCLAMGAGAVHKEAAARTSTGGSRM